MLILPLFAAFFPQKPGGGALFLTGQTRQTAQQSRENLREIEGGGIQISPAYKRRNRRRTARKTTQNQTGDKPPLEELEAVRNHRPGRSGFYTRGEFFKTFFRRKTSRRGKGFSCPVRRVLSWLVMEGGGSRQGRTYSPPLQAELVRPPAGNQGARAQLYTFGARRAPGGTRAAL